MKKIIYLILILLILTGCGVSKNKKEQNKNEKPNEEEQEQEIIVEKDPIDEMLEEMTLEEKIAQMIVIYFNGYNYTDTLKDIVTSVKPGGAILFKDNLNTTIQTRELIISMQTDSKIPMFISVDQEGGNVQRLTSLTDKKATYIPYMSELGKTNDTNLAYETGKVMASELRSLCFNMDYAPVVDVNSNPKNPIIGKRAFGTTSDIVEKMSIPLAKGLKEEGIIPVYKHFPGHGDTDSDSHVELPIINKTKEELYKLELKPFIKAIEEDADVIMIAHIALPKITNDNTPASLSKEIITDLLRDELGYQNLVIVDALNMKAIANNYTEEESTIKAIAAGVDLILMPNDAKKTIEIVKNAVNDGTLTMERINESVRRILKVKEKYNILNGNACSSMDSFGSKEHKEIISKITK